MNRITPLARFALLSPTTLKKVNINLISGQHLKLYKAKEKLTNPKEIYGEHERMWQLCFQCAFKTMYPAFLSSNLV